MYLHFLSDFAFGGKEVCKKLIEDTNLITSFFDQETWNEWFEKTCIDLTICIPQVQYSDLIPSFLGIRIK